MILLKNKFSKDSYTEISLDDAVKYDINRLVFTSTKDKMDYEQKKNPKPVEPEIIIEDVESTKEENKENTKKLSNVTEYIKKSLIDVESKVSDAMNNLSMVLNSKFKKNQKSSKLSKMLAYMDEEDIHELVERILNNDEQVKDVDLEMLLPYLDTKDSDELFINALQKNEFKEDLKTFAPFISEECLSKVVSEYIEGKHQDLEIEELYPYMNSKDIKKIFNYLLESKR